MTEAERLRGQAARALRLSLGSTTDDVKGTLRAMAAEYHARAAELEQREDQQRQWSLRVALQPQAEQQQPGSCKGAPVTDERSASA